MQLIATVLRLECASPPPLPLPLPLHPLAVNLKIVLTFWQFADHPHANANQCPSPSLGHPQPKRQPNSIRRKLDASSGRFWSGPAARGAFALVANFVLSLLAGCLSNLTLGAVAQLPGRRTGTVQQCGASARLALVGFSSGKALH